MSSALEQRQQAKAILAEVVSDQSQEYLGACDNGAENHVLAVQLRYRPRSA